jgi:hypothetical protein
MPPWYPYQTIGTVLVITGIGIMFAALGFLYLSHSASAHALGLFGNILFVIGSILSLYNGVLTPLLPINTIGRVLCIAGIVFITLGFLYPSHRTPPPTNPRAPALLNTNVCN